MKKLPWIILSALVVLAVVTPAWSQQGVLVLRADLSGAEEVPPVSTDTTGTAKFKADQDHTEIEFTLDLDNATDILGIAGGHLHCAPVGVNGPVVAFLAGPAPGGFDGSLQIRGTLTQDNVINDSCGATIDDLVQAMRDGSVYVNVHSVAHPGGEVRGQVHE